MARQIICPDPESTQTNPNRKQSTDAGSRVLNKQAATVKNKQNFFPAPHSSHLLSGVKKHQTEETANHKSCEQFKIYPPSNEEMDAVDYPA